VALVHFLSVVERWNVFNYPLMLAGREAFPVTIVLPQLVLGLMVQKCIVGCVTMGSVR
jgi:hypothetical protein